MITSQNLYLNQYAVDIAVLRETSTPPAPFRIRKGSTFSQCSVCIQVESLYDSA